MSAFVVDKAHIDAMVRAGLMYSRFGLRWFAVEYGSDEFDLQRDTRQLEHGTADQVGGMLVAENVVSVAHRYSPAGRIGEGWEDNLDLPGPVDKYYVERYSYPVMGGRVPSPVEALKLIDCYEYQSCEHDGWRDSEAKRFCEALRSALIGALPGYEDAPWEWRSDAPSVPETPPAPEPAPEPTGPDYSDRNEAIKAIRTALRKRSGKAWSVTGGRGTAWGWITISAPPKRLKDWGYMSEADRAELQELLGLEREVHCQGETVPASSEYRLEYVARAQGKTPTVHGTPYWD